MSSASSNVVVERRAAPNEDRQLEALKLLLNTKAAGTSGGENTGERFSDDFRASSVPRE